MSRLSIVMVSFNSRADLERSLQSLTEAAPSIDHEIVIVDNASTDGTPAYVREQWPLVRLIVSDLNLGFARASNLGVRHTSGELVLFLNPDTIVSPGAVDQLVSTLRARPDVAVVGPRIVDGRNRAELSFGAMMTPWAESRQKLLVWGNERDVRPIVLLVDRMTRRERDVDWVSGACLLIRRADLERIGGFDERFFMYVEDVDLCASVRRLGRRVLFSPDSEVVHLRGGSAVSAPQTARDAYRRSQVAFYAKHHPAWVPVLKTYLRLRGQLRNIHR